MAEPPPPPPLPPSLTGTAFNWPNLLGQYNNLLQNGTQPASALLETIREHDFQFSRRNFKTVAWNNIEQQVVARMLECLALYNFSDECVEPVCSILEKIFQKHYSDARESHPQQMHADETRPLQPCRDTVLVQRRAKLARTLRSVHLTQPYNVVRLGTGAMTTIQAPGSSQTIAIWRNFVQPATGLGLYHTPVSTLLPLSGPPALFFWRFVQRALDRPSAQPVLTMLARVSFPSELMEVNYVIFQKIINHLSAAAAATNAYAATAAAVSALQNIFFRPPPKYCELHVRTSASGGFFAPCEREANTAHARHPNNVGKFFVQADPAPGLIRLHVVRTQDSDTIKRVPAANDTVAFAFYARCTPAPGCVLVSTRGTVVSIHRPSDSKAVPEDADAFFFAPREQLRQSFEVPLPDPNTPQLVLRALALLTSELQDRGPQDDVVQPLAAAGAMLCELVRSYHCTVDTRAVLALCDTITSLFVSRASGQPLPASRRFQLGVSSTLTNGTYRCGTQRYCDAETEQCGLCALLQQREALIAVALEPISDLCMHLVDSGCREPALFDCVARCFAFLEEDPSHDLVQVCGKLRGLAVENSVGRLGAMLTTLFKAQLLSGDTAAVTDGPRGYVTKHNFFLGGRVVRSDRWHYDEQDGGAGHVGIIIGRDSENCQWVRVRWLANNSENVYEVEGEHNSTLYFADLAPDWFLLRNLSAVVRHVASDSPDGASHEVLAPFISAAVEPLLRQ